MSTIQIYWVYNSVVSKLVALQRRHFNIDRAATICYYMRAMEKIAYDV